MIHITWVLVDAAGESHVLFNLGGGANGTDLLLEVTYTPARHGEQVFETLAGAPSTSATAVAVHGIVRALYCTQQLGTLQGLA